jgi:transmembrane sensor
MTKIVTIPARDRSGIEAEARAWLVRLDGGSPDGTELRELREWLDRSPLHREAFERATATWKNLDALGQWLSLDVPPPAARPTRLRPAFAAMALLLVAALITWLTLPSQDEQGVYRMEHATAIGEVRTVPLPDGTEARLNTATRLVVVVDQRARLARLDAGEAWFRVARDPDRPFVVYADRLAVRAIGTAFSVRVDGNTVNLTVTEGRVEIAPLQEALPENAELQLERFDETESRMALDEGQHVVYDGSIEQLSRWDSPQIERSLSWRDGMLIFDDDTLADVLMEIGRYTPQKIVISDSDIQDLRFGGYFRVGDISSILATLEADFGLRVERINDNLVYLSRRRGSD